MRGPRITGVDVRLVGGSRWGWVVALVRTGDGLSGIGEGSLEGREQSVATAIGELARYLTGKDAFDIERHVFALYREAVWTGGAVLQSALSAVEMALWDLKGKYLGVPVYELLGGSFRSEIDLYANGWWYAGGSPQQLARAAKQVVERGYRGLKFNPFNRQPGGDAPFRLDTKVLARAADYVGAVREAVGPDVDLYLDYNAVFNSVGDAIMATRALAEYGPRFVEEPIPQENVTEMAYFRRQVEVPVATGERLFSPFAFEALLGARGVDVVQPDLCHCGGLLSALKIAALAEVHYVPVAPHNPNGPIGESASVQLAAAVPNFYVLEHFEPESWREEVTGRPHVIEDGRLRVGDRPGLGVDFDEEAAARHPFQVRDLLGFNEPTFKPERDAGAEPHVTRN